MGVSRDGVEGGASRDGDVEGWGRRGVGASRDGDVGGCVEGWFFKKTSGF